MSPIEIPAADPHSAPLIAIVPIEAMAQYAGYGAILLADIVAVGFDEICSHAGIPHLETASLELIIGPVVLITAAISPITLKTLSVSDYQPDSAAV